MSITNIFSLSKIRSKIRDFLIVSRINIQVGTPPNALIGILLAAKNLEDILNLHIVTYFILCILLVTFASNINCLYDISVDEKYKKHLSKAVRSLGRKNIKIILLIEVMVGFSLMYFLYLRGYFVVFFLAVVGLFLAIAYSMPPLRIKKRGFLSPLPVFFGLYLLIPVGGWYMVRNDLTFDAVIFFSSYFLMNSGFILVNVTEDYQEDREENIRTWAHIMGVKNTLKIALIFSLFGYLAIVVISKHLINKPFAILFLLFAIFGISLSSFDIYKAMQEGSIKRYAKKMPFWFIITRYPMVLALFVSLF